MVIIPHDVTNETEQAISEIGAMPVLSPVFGVACGKGDSCQHPTQPLKM